MKLTRRGFLAGAGAVAAGSAAWGLDPNRAWADEEVAEEPAGTDEAPAEEPAAPAGPIVVCEECPGACTLVLEVEDGRVAAVRGDGANPFSEGRLCLRAQALTDLWKAPEGATEDGAGGDGGNGAGGNDAASEGATTAGPGRLTSPRVRRAGSDAWEDISWDRALDEIATLVKDTRDATFEESIEGVEADDEAQGETDFDEWDWSDRGGYGDDGYGDNDYGARKRPRGVPVMRTRAIGSFGGARLVAEEQFLLAKALRSWGVVNIDSEAAFGRRAFAAGVAATLGIAEPDGLWSDIANTGCLLTLGADVATSQPLSLRWIERARDAGALWIAVDPLRSASAEMADIHVPIRPGTDIAFLGGLAKYAMDNSLWQPEYVLNFTNASYLMDPAFSFDASSGAFFGWDPMTGTYDKTSWGYQTDGFDTWNMRFDGEFSWVRGEGVPAWAVPSQPRCERNITLQDPACAWVRLQEFLARYDLDTVATVCGVERSLLERAYGAFAATGAVEGAGKVLAGPGLVQHGTGAQAARAAAVVQLLLGNIGVPGGGISYLGGAANEGLADAMGLSPDMFCGDLPWPTEGETTLQAWLEAHTEPAGAGSLRPRALVSALREWWGEEAAFDNDYGYDWLPKAPAGGASFSKALRTGLLQGCFLWGADLVGSASSGVTADDVGRLAWLVVTDGSPNLTATFWERVEDPSQQQTTVFQLPSALGFEKAGIRASGGRLLQHAAAAVEPAAESRTDAAIIGDVWERVFNLYDTKGGAATDPILKARWDYVTSDSIDLVKVAWAMNGYVVEDSDWDGGELVLLEGADGLRADGSTACGAAFLAGLWSNGASAADAAEQPVGRRDGADESGLGLFPGWGFTWPGNVRVRGNRASANLAGQPWVRERNLLTWEGESWACIDAPDFPILRDGRWLEPDNQAFPGTWEQVGLLVSDRLGDGPVPEHYEPLESPLNNRLNGAYASPVLLAAAAKASGAAGDDGAVDAAVADALAPDYSSMQADRAAYPIAAVINGSDGRDGARRALSETLAAAEPGCFVEMSASLARIRGLATGEWARVFNERGSVEAPVLVTDRIRPFQCEDNEGHYVCLNGMALGNEDAAAAVWGVLAPAAESPVGAARDVKGFLVDIEKA
ncbi:molybdopterin-dependent oxidoreductase [Adlercreutzia equolifaciens]|uniref:molybdopterin-dependent oxidoreductase n=1 Tax=Adlercreutzia equolifaciens TaxID=446660 RepID=UPI003AF02829